ncbi:hypothetical protein N781_13365 [Pontibacillus halophilus JSM 076056 = DSM 19796]|uniref:YfhO family protein n=1 Tax=Pontibacillus halophilus JSM 076056 = DSM 19796 TaxID=1385510 RepID=A0A0A5GM66_9BACI|nr:YfhO family protein [Pontibacillus halophilus]KGX93044.1 hypothetical protein N781_13365 [Pontibacillus halophilus JSM 076056 = DSM 19796]
MNQTRTWLALVVVAVATISIIPMQNIVTNGFFYVANGGDIKAQYIHYFNEFHELVRSGELPFWSWEYALGGSFWNDYGYYMLGDVFIWPLLALPVDFFPHANIPIAIIKLILMAVGAFLLLNKLHINFHFAFIGSLAYTFTGYHIEFFYIHYFFLNIAVFFPYILLGFERLTRSNKPALFVVMVFLASIGNFYFMFILTLGILLYALYRFFTLTDKKRIKGFVSYHLHWGLYYLIGLGLSMPIFLPSLYSFLNSNASYRPEIQQELYGGVKETLVSTYQLLSWNGGMSFFPLLFIPLAFIQFKRFKALVTLITVLLIIVGVPPLLSALGGFSNPTEFRSFPIVNMLMIVFTVTVLNQTDFTKVRHAFVLLLSSLFLSYLYYLFPFNRYPLLTAILPPVFATTFALFSYTKSNAIKRSLFVASASALILFSYITVSTFVSDLISKSTNTDTEQIAHKGVWSVFPLMDEDVYKAVYEDKAIQTVVNELRPGPEEFYRMNVHSNSVRYNSAMTYGYNHTTAYQSLLPWDVQQFEMDILAETGTRSLNLNKGYLNSTYMNSLIGNRYHIFTDQGTSGSFNLYGYEERTVDQSVVFENNYRMPFGFLYHDVATNEQLLSSSYGFRDRLLFETAFVNEENVDAQLQTTVEQPKSVKQIGTMSTIEWPQSAQAEQVQTGIKVSSDEPITFTLPIQEHTRGQLSVAMEFEARTPTEGIHVTAETDTGQSLAFQKNMSRGSYKLKQYHYSSTVNAVNFNFGIDESARSIHLTIKPGTFVIQKITAFIDDFSGYKEIYKQRQEEALHITEFNNNSLQGLIHVEEKGLLNLSIPYHEGWKAYVDDEEVNTIKVNSLLTGIYLDKGVHDVKLTFTPSGLLLGLIVFALSILAYFILAIRKPFRNNKYRI